MQFKYAALLFAALASFIGATASAVPPEQTGAVASSILTADPDASTVSVGLGFTYSSP